jgi:hypothetical protein
MGMPVTGHHVWGRAYGHDKFEETLFDMNVSQQLREEKLIKRVVCIRMS